jgi:hypothetical protein
MHSQERLQQTQFKFQFQERDKQSSFVPGMVGPREIATNPIQVPVSARDKQSSFVPGMVGPREIATNPIQVPV